MMKRKIFLSLLIWSILSFLYLFSSTKNVLGANVDCGGKVVDTSTNKPIEEVRVAIYVEGFPQPQNPCFDCNNIEYGAGSGVALTNSQGSWSYKCNCWPNVWSIVKIEFIKEGYLQTDWYPSAGIPYDCNSNTIEMNPEDYGGYACIDPDAALPKDKCSLVADGEYSDLTSCAVNCQRFKCYMGACVPCGLSEDIKNCPYLNSDCGNNCSILPSPTDKPHRVKDKVFCNTSNPRDGTTNVADSGYIYTAIGCIPVLSTPKFIEWILRWAIGIGGGIALMLIIVASFQIITSSGSPEKVQAGKELLTSAIAGLIMLIFSVFILKIIGIDILKLPGLK